MQLKIVGESLNVIRTINSTLKATSELRTIVGGEAVQAQKLAVALNGYSTEAIKAAIAQSSLSAEQIKAILTAKGLTDAEIQEVITTNALTASQTGATASTFGLGTAFKGLGLSIKTATKAMIAWMVSNPIGWIAAVVSAIGASIYGVVKLHDALTVSLEEQKEKLQETKEAYENVKNELQEVETELQNTQNKVEELENTPNLTWVDQEELNRLREVTKELELQKQLKQDAQLESAEDLYKENEKTFNKEFKSSYGNTSITDMKEQLEYGHIGTGQLDYENITDIVSALQYINEEKAKLTDESEIAEYENFINDLTDLVKSEGQDYLSSLSEYKQNILEIASIRDLTDDEQEFYDYLSSMQKAIYEYYSPATWNSLEFDSVFDTEGIEKTKEELISMYKSGELTSAEMLEQFPKLNQAIKESEIIAGEGSDVFKEFFNEIAAMADEAADIVNGSNSANNIANLFNQLTTSKDAFDKFQSSVKSAADAYSTLMSGNYSSSDMLDSIQAINAAVSDMGGSLDWEFIDTQTQLNSLDLLGGAIEHISQKYAESVLSGAGIDVDSKFGQMLANNIIQAQKASTQLEVLDDQIDSLQSAYSDLTDIVDMYNKTGSITFDQLQTLLEMEPQYLSCLIDENGQLQLNESAMAELANKRLDDAEAQAVQQAITELGQLALQDEKKAVQENAEAFTNAVNDLAGYNEELANTIAEATVGAAAIRDLNAAISGAESQGASDTQINTVLDNLNTKLQLIDGVRDKVAAGGLGSVVKSGSKSKSEKDTTKEFDWIEQAIENVEKEVKKLDDVVNSAYSTFSQKNEALAKEIGKVNEEIQLQQQAYDEYMRKADSIGLSDDYKTLIHDGAINIENISDKNLQEKISEYQQWYNKAIDASDAISELSTKVKDLHVAGYELQADRLEELFNSESITEKQYLEEMENLYKEYYENQVEYAQKAHEAKLALLDKEKSYLNSVASAAASLLDKEIDKIRDNAEAQEKPLNNQIDAYNEQIDLLNKKKKPLQDELDALEDKARQENLILDLQKKQYNLKKAENQRTKLLYSEDKGIHYANDPQAIKDAKKDVDGAKLEIQKNDIQKQIDALDDEIDRYNDLIDLVNDQIDAINKAADAQIDALEKIKNKWQEVIDQQEYAKNVSLLTGEFGTNAISKILTGNDDDLLAQWKDSYINTLAGIDMESQGYIGNMTQQIASLYGVDLSPLQNQFQNVKDSVNGMTDALGAAASAVGIGNVSGDTSNPATQDNMPASSTGTETSLENAIKSETDTAMNAFDQHTDKLTNEVIPAIQAATEEMNTFNEAADMDIEKTVTIHYETTGDKTSGNNKIGKAFAEGTTGKAFADGNDGLSHDEKNALRSEYGQPELTVYPDGNYEITTEPVISDLPKGTAVYNEEQTREIMSKKPQADGNIGAVVGNDVIKPNGDTLKPDGTVIKSNGVTIKPDGTIITPEGEVYEPLRPGDRMYDMLQKFQNYFNGIESRGETMYNSALVDHQKQMEQMINQITNYSSVVNNTKNVQPVVNNNEIHVTLPNVTDSTCAQELLRDLQSINLKKFQVNW